MVDFFEDLGDLAIDPEELLVVGLPRKDTLVGQLLADEGPEFLNQRAFEEEGNDLSIVVFEDAMKEQESFFLLALFFADYFHNHLVCVLQ